MPVYGFTLNGTDVTVDAPEDLPPGQIMAAVDLLERTSSPTDEDIRAIENVCRCGTYFHVRQAIESAAQKMG